MKSPEDKKILIITFLTLAMVAGVYYISDNIGVVQDMALSLFKRAGVDSVESESYDAQESIFESAVKVYYMPPVKIFINEKNIKASIVELGLTDDGFLDTPKNWNEAGWYKKSSKPGEDGNVIVNAHFDDNRGRPAAFYQLKNVTVGDTVLLEDSLGRLYAYQVVDSFLVDINDPDRLKVLESQDDKYELTLITCGGVWLQGRSTYDKRLVVKAELIESL